jgi:hypothetical protein
MLGAWSSRLTRAAFARSHVELSPGQARCAVLAVAVHAQRAHARHARSRACRASCPVGWIESVLFEAMKNSKKVPRLQQKKNSSWVIIRVFKLVLCSHRRLAADRTGGGDHPTIGIRAKGFI